MSRLMNRLLYTWYALPVVSVEWQNFPVITINSLGVILKFSFIVIYIWFVSNKNKLKQVTALMGVVVMFSMIAVISTFVLHDHRHRKMFVESIGMAASVAMYLLPQKQVIMTKSMEFMPFYLSLFSLSANSLGWHMGSWDMISSLRLIDAESGGESSGVLQLILYCKYRKRRVPEGEHSRMWEDLESNKPHESN